MELLLSVKIATKLSSVQEVQASPQVSKLMAKVVKLGTLGGLGVRGGVWMSKPPE